ncbi:MAG: TonB-dependent receptor [Pseudomonadota bacterium]
MSQITRLPIFIASTLSVATSSAFAQSNETENSAIDTVTVTATPIRDSQVAAIEAKRNADNVVEIVAADTIGRFPDQNLADSLGRVPGLAIERDQGQARFINFRGAPFRYTKIAFDGIDVLGAEDGRIPRFDAFPAVITSRIDINKAITPDMPGESTVGFVNIRTFSPFDREGLHVSGEVGRGNQELGDVDIDKYNGRLSFSNEKFGFLVFGSHNLRGRITDNREFEYADTTGDGVNDSVVNLDFRSYRGEREDNAFGGRLEFRPTDTTSVYFSSLFSEFIDREERNQFDFDFDPIALGTADYRPTLIVSRLAENGDYNNSTFTNTLGLDTEVAGWEIETSVNFTETENDTDLPIPLSAGAAVGADIDVTNIYEPVLGLTAAGQPGTTIDVNTLDYAANLGLIVNFGLDTEATKLKFDASRPIEVGGRETTLKLGVQFDTREADGGDTLGFGGFPDTVDINSFVTSQLWSSDFNNSIAGRDIDNTGLISAWSQAVGGLQSDFDPDSLIGIEEDVVSLYTMATTDFSWGNLVYGARVELTEFSTSGTLVNDDGSLSPITTDDDYTNVLPSIHANIDLNDDVKLRLSASSGISRPRYSEVTASQTVDPVTLEVGGGNPFLDPELSYGVDAALEYYFQEASLVALGVYHRQIEDVIYPGSTTVDGSLYAPGLIPAGTPTLLNSFFNGEDGELTGVELNVIADASQWLPAPFDGFGFSGNVTFVDSSFSAPTLGGRSFDLPGTSDFIYNASVFYEKFGLSVRVNYQYRDAWLSTTENDSLNEFWDETTRLDASIRYIWPTEIAGGTLTFALNGNNLSNERDVRFIDSPATPNQIEGFGRRWAFSVRFDY